MASQKEIGEDEHVRKSWEHWHKLGSPKFIVAPMVDQSELPFRMLCRQYGATAAYTPMLHARLFSESLKYRAEQLTTCEEDRPLFVQFCSNDPDVLVKAAKHVDNGSCDYIDLNFGCPQRIAKKGRYGAFLMDDLPVVKSLVQALHERAHTPVSVKIRIFPELEDTLKYAQLLERAGASLVAVHGRTRDQKNAKEVRADWDAIKAVKATLRVPVLGNGDVRCRSDAERMMEYTGVDGVMSAAPLLDDPTLFSADCSGGMVKEPGDVPVARRFDVALEYLELAEKHPVPVRMVRGHLHKIIGGWMQEFTDIRDSFVRAPGLTVDFCKDIVRQLKAAAISTGRSHPVPKLTERKRAQLEREEAIAQAKAEQAREDADLAGLPSEQNGKTESKGATKASSEACERIERSNHDPGSTRQAKQPRLSEQPGL